MWYVPWPAVITVIWKYSCFFGGSDIFNAAGNAAVSLKRVPFESFKHNLCLLISETFNEVHKSFPVNKKQSYKKNLTFPGHKFKKKTKTHQNLSHIFSLFIKWYVIMMMLSALWHHCDIPCEMPHPGQCPLVQKGRHLKKTIACHYIKLSEAKTLVFPVIYFFFIVLPLRKTKL